MTKKTSKYIGLQAGEHISAEIAERRYQPETRPVYLSGNCRRWFMDRGDGIPLLESGRQQQVPILDLKTFLRGLLYGISTILALVGLWIMIGKNKGELNGGNA